MTPPRTTIHLASGEHIAVQEDAETILNLMASQHDMLKLTRNGRVVWISKAHIVAVDEA